MKTKFKIVSYRYTIKYTIGRQKFLCLSNKYIVKDGNDLIISVPYVSGKQGQIVLSLDDVRDFEITDHVKNEVTRFGIQTVAV